MLEMRATCEKCEAGLPEAADARICSFECTFCRTCVDEVLQNVCPNCGGGFSPRPVRPASNYRGGNDIGTYPPATERRHRPVDPAAHLEFARHLRDVPAHRR